MDLIDELLDDPASDGSSFLLDGQAIVLEDYLAVRPERASELAGALRDGRLEAGPWYVLADELIPSGEALVRNLLAGRRGLRALRAEPPPVLYCPDSFGHPAALPAVARGFGCDLIVVWRGAGGAGGSGGASGQSTDLFSWRAPDGDAVLTYHLSRSGYELGANLPVDPDASRARWLEIRQELAERSATGVVLLPNGADHHARQLGRPAAVAALASAAAPDRVVSSDLGAFARAVSARMADSLPKWQNNMPEWQGELRSSHGYTWTLQGTIATRTPQKRRYVQRERELLRDVEPWVAFAWFQAGTSLRHHVNAAWRSLLQCQPHDTLCGCSIDDVARAMDDRLSAAGAQASGVREDAIHAWIGHDAESARRDPDAWRSVVLVRNRAARARSGVAIVELTTKIADVPVGAGSAHVALDRRVLPRTPRLEAAGPVQVLARRIGYDRIESPRHYPDNDAVQRLQAAIWVEDVPGYGIVSLPFTRARARAPRPVERVHADDGVLSNGRVTVRLGDGGAVTLEAGGRTLENCVEWESRRDRGDLYTPAIREPKLTPRLLNTRLVHRGPWRASAEQRWRLRGGDERIDVRLRFVLDAGANWLRVRIAGVNAARDHRLRLRFRTDVGGGLTVADAAFALVERSPVAVDGAAAAMEEPVPTAPLQRYVSLYGERAGATVFSDGLAEVETDGADVVVTVLRSVGELSRSDIAERPGHAGWPAATPEAQCVGPFEAELAVMLHGPRGVAVVDEIERAADDILFPLAGETLRAALRVPPPAHGATLHGAGLACSAIKESEDGAWLVLRCVNLLDRETAGSWRVGRPVSEACLARLDETPLTPLRVDGDTIHFLAPPRGIVTLLVK